MTKSKAEQNINNNQNPDIGKRTGIDYSKGKNITVTVSTFKRSKKNRN
ncbi:MAG: hypothetical protein LBE57_07540 [Methanosarcinales archaeon]|jgi:hypothetical protein|nr:hypothetical protein [Methanosarcinales archaeon]